MKIISLKRRTLPNGQPGTLHENFLGSGIDYLFAPVVKDGPHICEVKDKEHAKVFLRISEGYDPVMDDDGVDEVKAEIKADKRKEKAAQEKDQAQKQGDLPDIMSIDTNDKKKWQTKALSNFAEQAMGINPKSKSEIRDYAEDEYDIILPTTIRSPGPLLRLLIERIQEKRKLELTSGDDNDYDKDLEDEDLDDDDLNPDEENQTED